VKGLGHGFILANSIPKVELPIYGIGFIWPVHLVVRILGFHPRNGISTIPRATTQTYLFIEVGFLGYINKPKIMSMCKCGNVTTLIESTNGSYYICRVCNEVTITK